MAWKAMTKTFYSKYDSRYESWRHMRQRCNNPKDRYYARYGGRGITVCARWCDFLLFCKDMGPRPSLTHSIDRIDNDGNYEPGNCRWATWTQQNRNSTRTRHISFRGERHCLTEWACRLGIDKTALRSRIAKYGEQGAIEMGLNFYAARRNQVSA